MGKEDQRRPHGEVNEVLNVDAAPGLKRLAINDEGFIFDPATGESYTANQTGIEVLKAFVAGRSIRDAADALSENFAIVAEEAEKDIVDFVNHLKALHLL